jgi:glyoxylase-like metal-dependent hydrolase (beta-lactamase superfamily II)
MAIPKASLIVARKRQGRGQAIFMRFFLLFVGLLSVAFAQQQPTREITKIAGEVYRFRNVGHFSVFAVTPAGIIVTDPIDAAAATWLKAELKTRFNQPVKYVVYSHSHADHASGGEVFADTATFVAHEATKTAMANDKVKTQLPTETFRDAKTLTLGGTIVELAYVGRNHGDGGIAMRFPKERILFAVDFIPVESIGYRDFPGAFFPDWLESLRRVEAMDFDILAPGHGPLGTKAHVRMHREYLEDLQAQVARVAGEGKSVEEAKKAVNLDKYQKWSGYAAMRDLNIEGMYRIVKARR